MFTMVNYFSNVLASKIHNQKQEQTHSHLHNHTVFSDLSSHPEGSFTIMVVPFYQDPSVQWEWDI